MLRHSRMMVVLGLALCTAATNVIADDGPKWMRYPAISPDGSQIAFSYRGDLWLVSSEGGDATLLTTHADYERAPVWSPDGKHIAFASDRHGNFDVFLISANGGVATRLTHHSASDIPNSFSHDGKEILFSSRRLDAPVAAIGSSAMGELYSISIDGGRPSQVMTTEAEHASIQPNGDKIVYQDYKGFENIWRKHHTSSVTRDIWIYDPADQSHLKISPFEGEDRDPVWSPDGESVFFLSEKSGTMNVWKTGANGEGEPTQITKQTVHPVRFLSMANDGTMAFGFNGDIFVKAGDADAKRLEITAVAGSRTNDIQPQTASSGATEMAVSPNEDEIAIVIRGEVYVTSIEFGTTKRVTNTPEQERSVSWSKDGRSLYYAGERSGSWNLYRSKITREDEGSFTYATLVTEEPVLVTEDETFQPVVSPDGKKLAFLKNRYEIMLLDLDTMQPSTIVPGAQNFSYTDGDIDYAWSSDSKWLTFTYMAQRSWTQEIGVANVATGEITNISNSGYSESYPRFSSNGEVLMYVTDRYGERSHGSWGSEDDVHGFYLTQDAYDKISLSKEELELQKRRKQRAEESTEEDESKTDDDEKASDDEEDLIEVDLSKPELRTKRLTLHSALISSLDLSPDGETLVYMAQVENNNDLWISKVRDQTTYKIYSTSSSAPGFVKFSKDGKSVFFFQSGRAMKLDMAAALSPGGKAKPKPISYAAELTVNGPAERAYLFEHAWRQAKQKFYDPNLHGVDWEGMKQNYIRFLPSINNNHDFAELLSELLGELNASHTGSGYRLRKANGDSTAALGLLYDVDYNDVGLKVGEVIPGGPLDTADSKVEAGVVITHFDGVRLTSEVNPWQLLNHRQGKPLRLALLDPDSNKEWEELVIPISSGAENNLLYERWIAKRRELCEEVSGGRIGYVHVRGMNDASFRRVYSEVLGVNNDKEALIVDTRFNGGGWLHDHLVTFLSGEEYIYFVPRRKEMGDLGGEPIGKWTKPVAVLQSESNYSDAHFFPWAFKELNVGTLVGAPVPGTATAVWWETLIDPTLYFGIPQVGMKTRDGEYLENKQLEPDVLVINDPESMAKGEDKQLVKAVEVLIEQLDK